MSSDIVFGLESAAWPALLVDPRGVVVRANSSALSVFGEPLKAAAPPLSSVWSPENTEKAEQFLTRWEAAPLPTARLKFLAGGGVTDFQTSICAFNREGRKWFVFQLLPASAPPPAPVPQSAPPPQPNAVQADNGPDTSLNKQKLDAALQLARAVSLDFNNALTSVLGHTSLLLTKAEPGHPWRHSLMEVEKSAARAAEISNELDVLSDEEKQAHRAPPGNLNDVVMRCVDFFRNNHSDKISWDVKLEQELFATRFDEAKLQQGLTKVLENAVEAVSNGGEIRVQTRNVELAQPAQDRGVRLAAGAHACIEVSDNGAGIEAAHLSRVFEPFFTTKKAPHRGLGLALLYGIVSSHGGGVAVSSQPGAGASVRIYLPAEKQAAGRSAATEENLHGIESILVVDDESLLLTMAETILVEYGYKVLTATSGQKAMALLARDDVKVDLLVTDLVMPAMGGRELIERVRELGPGMKVLCTSGVVLSTEQQMGLTYLQKPFSCRDLLFKARLALGKG